MPITAVVEKNAYEAAMENFDLAADALELDNDVRNMIKSPERVLTVHPARSDGQREDSLLFRVTACNTAPRAGLPKAESATIRT